MRRFLSRLYAVIALTGGVLLLSCHTAADVGERPETRSGIFPGHYERLAQCTAMAMDKEGLPRANMWAEPNTKIARLNLWARLLTPTDTPYEGLPFMLFEITFHDRSGETFVEGWNHDLYGSVVENEVWPLIERCAKRLGWI